MRITPLNSTALSALRATTLTQPSSLTRPSSSPSSSSVVALSDTASFTAPQPAVVSSTDVLRLGQDAFTKASVTRSSLLHIDSVLERMQQLTDQAFDQPSLYAAEMSALRDSLDHLASQKVLGSSTLDGSASSLAVGGANITFVTSAMDSNALGLSHTATASLGRSGITETITAARAVVAHQLTNVSNAVTSITAALETAASQLTSTTTTPSSGFSANTMLHDAGIASNAALEMHSLMMSNSAMALNAHLSSGSLTRLLGMV